MDIEERCHGAKAACAVQQHPRLLSALGARRARQGLQEVGQRQHGGPERRRARGTRSGCGVHAAPRRLPARRKRGACGRSACAPRASSAAASSRKTLAMAWLGPSVTGARPGPVRSFLAPSCEPPAPRELHHWPAPRRARRWTPRRAAHIAGRAGGTPKSSSGVLKAMPTFSANTLRAGQRQPGVTGGGYTPCMDLSAPCKHRPARVISESASSVAFRPGRVRSSLDRQPTIGLAPARTCQSR